MELIQAIILGIIQGITEWLPISSSGHLAITQQLFNLQVPLAFDVLLHLGSLLVILIFFRKDIWELIVGLVHWKKKELRIILFLLVASIPIALVGFFLQDKIALAFGSLQFVGFMLLFTALLLFLTRFSEHKKKKEKLSWKSILIMGLVQAIAILPGVSRSGSTISAGLLLGVKKEEAARFSFLLFIPAIIGAVIVELPNMAFGTNTGIYILGMLISAIVGFACLGLLMHIIRKGKFSWFSIYCFVLGIVVLILA